MSSAPPCHQSPPLLGRRMRRSARRCTRHPGPHRSHHRGRRGDPPTSACELGNGVSHVISIVFDNVHFFRDNPNVPSDLEQMPHLLSFLEQQRHGPVQHAHADDRPHRRRQPDDLHGAVRRPPRPAAVQHATRRYNPDGTTDPAASFAYWTARSSTRRPRPTPGHDTRAVHGLLADRAGERRTPTARRRRRGCRSPGPAAPSATSPPPTWCSRTPRSTSRRVFGAGSPEVRAVQRRPRQFKDPETADYIGDGRALRAGAATCADAHGGEVRPDVADPDGGPRRAAHRAGRLQRLPGAVRRPVRRAAARAGTPNLTHNGYPVTDANGNLTDLDGNAAHGPVQRTARLPRLQPHRLADAGVPGRHAGDRRPGDLRLHLRHPRAQGRTSGCTTATATATRQADRPRRQLLR